jgi:glycosyltransferase involved in cell wall biosynthesis
MALEALDLREYDLVISVESGPAKGVITHPRSLHLCYCLSPMRYIWDHYHVYRENAGPVTRFFLSTISPALRVWDVTAAARVDQFAATSRFVAQRIRKFYRRDAVVIYPPVSVNDFSVSNGAGNYYLCAGQLVRYKRVDLAVKAFVRNGKRLVVAGAGEEATNLQKLGAPNIEFIGRQTDEQMRLLMQDCCALVFPGEEDFGIIPVEVMACGRPVIAYGSGGALETVVDGKTGILFYNQTVEALNSAILEFERHQSRFQASEIRQHAASFDLPIFKQKFCSLVNDLITLC